MGGFQQSILDSLQNMGFSPMSFSNISNLNPEQIASTLINIQDGTEKVQTLLNEAQLKKADIFKRQNQTTFISLATKGELLGKDGKKLPKVKDTDSLLSAIKNAKEASDIPNTSFETNPLNPSNDDLDSELLYSEPNGLNIDTGLPKIDKNSFKQGVYY